ncbi:transposase [Escherichia coli]|nr:transposase [Escherichia coli]
MEPESYLRYVLDVIVELATLTWVDWYNNRRLLERLGHIPPAEAEKAYYASIGNDDLAA